MTLNIAEKKGYIGENLDYLTLGSGEEHLVVIQKKEDFTWLLATGNIIEGELKPAENRMAVDADSYNVEHFNIVFQFHINTCFLYCSNGRPRTVPTHRL